MKFVNSRRPSCLARLGVLLALCAATLVPAHAAERGPIRRAPVTDMAESEARVIVKFKADSALMRVLSATSGAALPQHAQTMSARLGIDLADGRVLSERTQVMKAAASSGLTSAQLAERLAAQDDVEYAVVDRRMRISAVVPNDPLYGPQTTASPAAGQWYLRAPNSTTITSTTSVLSAINAEAAWPLTTGSSSVVVAVLDTGVRFDHPDLTTKLLPGYDFIVDATEANDGGGVDADASDPGDYGCATATSQTSSWHGTQTAGLIGAATDNGIGMASVGRNTMLLPVRVIGKCGGAESDIVLAMQWAVGLPVNGIPANTHPAKVLNLSFGTAGACDSFYADAISKVTATGAVVVVAAGNEGLALDSPANCPGVIAVAGLRHAGTKVGYSNLGSGVTLSAPAGNCVNSTGECLYPLLTTVNTGTTTPVLGAAGAAYTSGGGDATLGTSFSAPLVAGTLALMYAADPLLTPAQAINALKSSARPFPSTGAGTGITACTAPTATAQQECYCTTTTCGAGMLDTGAAVSAAAALAPIMASVALATSSVAAGASATFDGSSSNSALGGLTYQWSITSGSTLASFSSATNAATVTLLTSAAGSVTVSLTVTDSAGRTATNSAVLTVTAPVAATPPAAPTTSSGGGGAMSPAWLLAWLIAVVAVRRVTPRRHTV